MAFKIDILHTEWLDRVVPEMIREGQKIVYPVLKRNLESAIGSNLAYPSKSTGQLLSGVTIDDVQNQKNRFKGTIYFKGTTPKGVRAGEKAAYKNYGTPHRANHNQEPTLFINNAVETTKGQVRKIMEKRLEDELKNI